MFHVINFLASYYLPDNTGFFYSVLFFTTVKGNPKRLTYFGLVKIHSVMVEFIVQIIIVDNKVSIFFGEISVPGNHNPFWWIKRFFSLLFS